MDEENYDTLSIDTLIPCCGVGCCIYSIWSPPTPRDFIGTVGRYEILCCSNKYLNFKLPQSSYPEPWLKQQGQNCTLHKPTTCCEFRERSFCIDQRVSIPPNEEVPCLFTVCFLTLMYKFKGAFGLMKNVSELEGK